MSKETKIYKFKQKRPNNQHHENRDRSSGRVEHVVLFLSLNHVMVRTETNHRSAPKRIQRSPSGPLR
jgi:hypothetical protein